MGEVSTVTSLRNINDAGRLSAAAAEITHHLEDDETRSILRARYLLGTLKQYSESHGKSFLELTKLRNNSKEQRIGAFLLRRSDGVAIGLATVQPSLELRRYRTVMGAAIPLSPRIARFTPLETVQETPGSFVEAWTAAGYTDELNEAYKVLGDPSGLAKKYYPERSAWTVEPKDSASIVHAAIKAAGFNKAQEGHFEHDSTRYETPPHSILYQNSPLSVVS